MVQSVEADIYAVMEDIRELENKQTKNSQQA